MRQNLCNYIILIIGEMKFDGETFPDRYRLSDGAVTLRPFVPADKERLAELADNVNIFRNLRDGFPHPYTLADADKVYRHVHGI